ncbi:MAG: response regulator transcription factor [Bacteroidales bacterium]|nr:response regulator transcription factor [Bacteroidales bacterium]
MNLFHPCPEPVEGQLNVDEGHKKDSAFIDIVTSIEMVMEGKDYPSQEAAGIFTGSLPEPGSIEAVINPLEALSERQREIL